VQGEAVVEVGESNAILCPHRLADDDLVDVVEFIPVLITKEEVRGGRDEVERRGGRDKVEGGEGETGERGGEGTREVGGEGERR